MSTPYDTSGRFQNERTRTRSKDHKRKQCIRNESRYCRKPRCLILIVWSDSAQVIAWWTLLFRWRTTRHKSPKRTRKRRKYRTKSNHQLLIPSFTPLTFSGLIDNLQRWSYRIAVRNGTKSTKSFCRGPTRYRKRTSVQTNQPSNEEPPNPNTTHLIRNSEEIPLTINQSTNTMKTSHEQLHLKIPKRTTKKTRKQNSNLQTSRATQITKQSYQHQLLIRSSIRRFHLFETKSYHLRTSSSAYEFRCVQRNKNNLMR